MFQSFPRFPKEPSVGWVAVASLAAILGASGCGETADGEEPVGTSSPTDDPSGPATSPSGTMPMPNGEGGTSAMPPTGPNPPVTSPNNGGTPGVAPPPGPGGAGGAGGSPEPGPEAPVRSTDGPSYAATVEPIFAAACTAGCHEPGGILGGPGGFNEVELDLTTGAGYAQLTDGLALQVPTMWIVGSGTADSYLWHKLNDTQASVGGEGSKMPFTGDPLTAEEIAAVEAWIEGGAAP